MFEFYLTSEIGNITMLYVDHNIRTLEELICQWKG